jgi:hypothetical protein
MDFVEQVQDFIANISVDIDNIVIAFLECDRDLEIMAEREIEEEVELARGCVGGGGGQTPSPTH